MNVISHAKKFFGMSAVAMAAVMTVSSVSPAAATQAEKATVAGSGAVRFDWMEGGQSLTEVSNVRVASTAPVGNGTWVCSPAGFGSHSKCYKR